jgi:5'-3' exoribonuclease 2
MNQQRSRRFRAARDEKRKRDDEEKVKKEWEASGDIFPESEKKEHFDSNCITPGTPFMARLADCLRYYIAHRLNTDPGWKNVRNSFIFV